MRTQNSLFYLTLFLIFLSYIINLNYNTPFNDEAIYIVIGRLGLFAGDWFTYGAGFWMAGFPFFYPSFTALAYQIGGIIGSRFLNVVFGIMAIEEIYRFTRQLRLFDPDTNQLAGIIAATVLGFSAAGTFVPRLATYDMPCFFLLLLSANCFLKAGNYRNGKYYFLSAAALFASFLIKIVAAVYYPPLLLLSLFILRSRDPVHRSLYLKYFIIPLAMGLALYALLYSAFLTVFTQTHINEGVSGTARDILTIIWNNTFPAIILSLITAPVLLLTQKARPFFLLFLLALVIPVFHLVLNRVPTLDKHLYLSVAFLSVGIGYSLAWLARNLLPKPIAVLVLPLLIFIYFLSSRPAVSAFEHNWPNTSRLTEYLHGKVNPADRILTETGSAVVLALYDRIYPPTHTVTFDWIDYSGMQGVPGYAKAVQDKYFDYIELDNLHTDSAISTAIHFNMIANYSLIYSLDGFDIYAKIN